MAIRRRSDTYKQLALGRLRVGGPKTTPRNTTPRQQKRRTAHPVRYEVQR